MRQIVLDTETTGLEPGHGHRSIEIGCVELLSRRATGRRFHRYLNPDRDIDEGALAVHGLTRAELEREPRFAEIAEELIEFIRGAELIIHNAAFDVAFIDAELARLPGDPLTVSVLCPVLDSLALARELHGALLDAQLLAEVYLAMTGGQGALALGDAGSGRRTSEARTVRALVRPPAPLRVIEATAAERSAHEAFLDLLAKKSGGRCLWRAIEAAAPDSGEATEIADPARGDAAVSGDSAAATAPAGRA
jgi:DNA polymerase-3 subunit epsilon